MVWIKNNAYIIGVKHYYTTYTVDTMQPARENHHHMYNAMNFMILKLLPESLASSIKWLYEHGDQKRFS